MKPGPNTIAHILLAETNLDASPIALVDVTTRLILEKRWERSKEDARELAERWQIKIQTIIRNEINSYHSSGRPTRICFNSSSDYIIQGACFVEPKDTKGLRDSRARRLKSSRYFETLKDLAPRQLEFLCVRLLELLEVRNPTVTRSSGDEGIDFYGLLPFESIFFPHDLTPTLQKQLCIWLVGQAKHYDTIQCGTSEIRDLVGAITLGRAQAVGSTNSPLKDLKIRVGDPVFAILITTGTFSANAWRLIQRSGVIGMDGEMLAAFLADRKAGLGSRFSRKRFIEWLEEMQP